MPSFFLPFCIYFILLFSNSCAGFDPSKYSSKKQLIPSYYTLHWRVAGDYVYMAAEVNTTGWVGFGIGETTSGSMPGSDMFIGYVINGQGKVEDRHAMGFTMPLLDSCQNWNLEGASETDGMTVIEVSRLLNTSDPQDRVITSGTTRVVAAFGKSDELSYHFDSKTTDEIVFFGSEVLFDTTLPADVKTIDLVMPNYTVPNKETVYACYSFAVPIDKQYHVVRVDPIVDPRNFAHVHHFIGHMCIDNGNSSTARHFQKAGMCSDSPAGAETGCFGLVAAWAHGGGPTFLPPQAGFPMGPSNTSLQYLVLQIHYHNPDSVAGYQDASGVRLYYTETLRQYDAGYIMLGDVGISLPDIPAQSTVQYETECLSRCTQSFPHPLNVFGSGPHMHSHGTEIWSTQWRDDELVRNISRIEFWAVNHQQNDFVNFTILPGDRLNTHCVYENPGSTPVRFGESSSEEMCLHFLAYYPVVITSRNHIYSACGSAGNFTYCGDNDRSSIIQVSNPQHRDPPGAEAITFGVQDLSQCKTTPINLPASSSDSDSFSKNFVIGVTASAAGIVVVVALTALVLRKAKPIPKYAMVEADKEALVEANKEALVENEMQTYAGAVRE